MEKPLPIDSKEDLMGIPSYRNFLQNHHGPINTAGKVDITSTTRDEYLDFLEVVFIPSGKAAIKYDDATARTAAGSPRPPTTPSNASTRTYTEVERWDKGVKRDATAFSKLTKDHQWDDYDRSLVATCKAQNVHNVLDQSYSPAAGTDDAALFERQKIFMYDVFSKTLKTAKGEEIVRKYASSSDAQKVYGELRTHYQQSITGTKRAEHLQKLITTSKIPEVRNKTLQTYIAEWKKWVQEHNKIAAVKMDGPTQLTHLKNYVKNVDDLDGVSSLARVLASYNGGGTAITATNEIGIYEATAVELDNKEKERLFNRERRLANQTMSLGAYGDDEDEIVDVGDDVESFDYEVYLTRYGTQRHYKRYSLDKQTWDQIPPREQEIYDQLSNATKDLIIGYGARRAAIAKQRESSAPIGQMQRDNNTNADGSPVSPATRRVNTTEMVRDEENASENGEQKLQAKLAECIRAMKTDNTFLMDSLKGPRISKEQAANIDTFDIRNLLNQTSDFTSHKTKRHAVWKKEGEARKEAIRQDEKAAKELKEANRERFKKGLLGQLRKTVTWK